VRDAKDRLQSVGARLLGTILNDVDINGGDYYYYNRYYHSYYQESVEQTASGELRQSARNE
jgi:Mrp family chromosome partitioning ATPase